jgi:hypothetical protein
VVKRGSFLDQRVLVFACRLTRPFNPGQVGAMLEHLHTHSEGKNWRKQEPLAPRIGMVSADRAFFLARVSF